MKYIQLFIKNLNGKTITIDLPNVEATGLDVKNKIFEKEKIPVNRQSLVTGTKILLDNLSLNDQHIKPECTLHLSIRWNKA